MTFRDSALKDDALMGFVPDLMVIRHKAMLEQQLPAPEKEALV